MTTDEARAYCETNGVALVETSALDDSNVDLAFEQVGCWVVHMHCHQLSNTSAAVCHGADRSNPAVHQRNMMNSAAAPHRHIVHPLSRVHLCRGWMLLAALPAAHDTAGVCLSHYQHNPQTLLLSSILCSCWRRCSTRPSGPACSAAAAAAKPLTRRRRERASK